MLRLFIIGVIATLTYSCMFCSNDPNLKQPVENQDSTVENVKMIKHMSSVKLCEKLEGTWNLHERDYEIEEIYCESGTPCGLQTPDLELICKEGQVKGKTLLYYDSKQQRAVFAEITGRIENQELVLSFSRNSRCSLEYLFSDIQLDSMSGTVQRVGCPMYNAKIARVFAKRAD